MAKLTIDQQSTVWAAAPGTDEGALVGRNATGEVGFFGTTPIPKPTIPATPTAAQVAAVLVALGLANQAT